jgi:RHS repeat-associated protein
MSSRQLSAVCTRGQGAFYGNEASRTNYVPDDADGNMTTKIDKKTGDSTIFTWDIENKLTEVRKTGMDAKYTYDALGRRMSKTVNGETKKFGYSGNDLILEMNDQDSVIASYTYGPGSDDPLVMNRNGMAYYYKKDGLGSVVALTDSAGNVLHEYKYSVYGKMVEETGNAVENPFTYTSRELDQETGLLYNRARFYDPQIGRFISKDPIGFDGGDVNLYVYVFNSPTNYIDPLGLGGWKYEGLRTVTVKDERLINSLPVHEEYNPQIHKEEVVIAEGSYTGPDNQTVTMSHKVGERDEHIDLMPFLLNLLKPSEKNLWPGEEYGKAMTGVVSKWAEYLKFEESAKGYYGGLLPPTGKWLQYLKLQNGIKDDCGK